MQANITIDRRTALREIKQKLDIASVGCNTSTASGGLAIPNPVLAIAGLAGATAALENTRKLSQIVGALTAILDAFEESQEIEYLTSLEVPDNGTLDLLVKFLTARKQLIPFIEGFLAQKLRQV